MQVNAQGFRKILKKYDKRSKSTTKDAYLARQIEIQPCFNSESLTELTDVAASSVHEIDALIASLESCANGYVPKAPLQLQDTELDLKISETAESEFHDTFGADEFDSDLAEFVLSNQEEHLRDLLSRHTLD